MTIVRPAGSDRRVLLLLVAIALFARAITFGDPVIHVDEEFYWVTAHEMGRGALPFVDIWDRKPIGLFLLFMPAAWLPLPWGSVAYQAMATLSLILTALVVMRLATRAGWRSGAMPAALAYVLWPDLLNGVGGQAPIFYNLPMAAAAALIVAAEDGRRSHARGAAAMVLVGIALQIKYSVVFEGLFFGLWLVWREWEARRAIFRVLLYAGALVTLALLPTIAAFTCYAAIGQADAFLFANFLSIQHRNANPLRETLGNIATLVLILSPLVAMACATRGRAVGGSASTRRFLLGWFGAALAGLALFGTWFDHYGLPALVPGCTCAAAAFGTARFRKRATPAILVLVALAGQVAVFVNLRNRGDAAQFAVLARAVGSGPGCLYVYSGTTMLYAETGRCRLSRYLVPSHLNRTREDGATGVNQEREVRRILAARPAVIVMRPPFRGERGDIRAIVLAAVARDYRLAARVPMGREQISVFKR